MKNIQIENTTWDSFINYNILYGVFKFLCYLPLQNPSSHQRLDETDWHSECVVQTNIKKVLLDDAHFIVI